MPAKHRMSQAEIEQTISFKDLCDAVDERDPRAQANQFPCFGTHSVPGNWMANASAVWKHCGRCGIRCVYAPRLGAPAKSMQASPLPADVVLALQRLADMYQQDNVVLDDITGKMVRSMIMQVQRGRLQDVAQPSVRCAQWAVKQHPLSGARVRTRKVLRSPVLRTESVRVWSWMRWSIGKCFRMTCWGEQASIRQQ